MSGLTAHGGERSWRFDADGVAVVITRTRTLHWQVVYGGFSRASSERLGDAIALAAGANPCEPWIEQIARSVARCAGDDASGVGRASRERPRQRG
jgi:hypothetical protein